MSIRTKRRETEVFSIAFLDCICCGFGAMLLVFILTVTQQKSLVQEDVGDVQQRVRDMEKQMTMSKEDADRMAERLVSARMELEAVEENRKDTELKLTDRRKEMLLLLQQTGAMKDALNVLLGEKKTLPTDEEKTIPIPNVERSQYLTGVKLQGDYILFLVRVSGSMLDETIDAAAARLGDPDYKKKQAPKWQRVLRSLEWMIATLDKDQHFKVVLFNDETVPLLPNRADEWFTRSDRQAMGEIVTRLNDVVPHGPANLERAFKYVRSMPRLADSVVLFTDGLPTYSDTYPTDGAVGPEQRVRFFDVAAQHRPTRVPISTILYPLSGDPNASVLYWELATQTRGAFVSPARDWPEQ